MRYKIFMSVIFLFLVNVCNGYALLLSDPSGDVINFATGAYENNNFMDIKGVDIHCSDTAIATTVNFWGAHGTDNIFAVYVDYTVNSIYEFNEVSIDFHLRASSDGGVTQWSENNEDWYFGQNGAAKSSVTWNSSSVEFLIGVEHGMSFSSDCDKWVLDTTTFEFAGVVTDYYDGATWYIDDTKNAAPVPEPSTIILFGIGLIGFAGVNRKIL